MRYLIAAALLILTTAPTAARAERVQQLRIYEVPSANEEVFHKRFRDQAMPIMRNYGFKILATWRSRFKGRTEFIYLLDWPDEATMTRAWAAFLADEKWKDIKRQTAARHGTFVENIEDRMLTRTDYSPTQN